LTGPLARRSYRIADALSAEFPDLFGHSLNKRRTALAFRHSAGIVVDLVGDGDLAAVLRPLDDQRLKAAASGVYAGSETCRAAPRMITS
jgi:fructose-1,6-bisphosphatase/sedoheptulose 1,7-bisphosphatase-like protein